MAKAESIDLDLSFLGSQPGANNAQQNVPAKNQQKSADLDLSFLKGSDEAPVHDPAMQEITSYGQSIPTELKIALGHVTTLNPDAQADIVKNNVPGAKVYKDSEGAYVVDINGEKGFINKPGMSPNDFTSFIGNALQYVPAAKLANLGRSLIQKMGIAAPSMYATNQGQQALARGMGSDQPNSQAESALAGAFGAAGEAAVPVLAPIVKPLANRVKGMMPKSRSLSPIDASQNAAVAIDPEFNIPYTYGQKTGKTAELMREESFRKGGLGQRAQDVMGGFDESQARAIDRSVDVVQRKISPKPLSGENEGGAIFAEGLKGRSSAARDAIGEAYEEVGDAYLSTDGLSSLMKRLKRPSKSVDFDRSLPQTSSVLTDISSMQKMLKAFSGKQLKPTHIKRLELMRRRLNTKIDTAGKNTPDGRQVLLIKKEFDRGIDEAVEAALFSGDEAAIEALKAARSLRAEYGVKYAKTGRYDEAGGVLQRIIETPDITPEQVVNYLFGRADIGGKGASVNIVKRAKEIFGEGAEEIQALRQMAVLRIINGPRQGKAISGKMMSQRFADAAKGRGESLMKELFTPKEIAMLGRYVKAVEKAQPSPYNPSGTADALSRIAQNVSRAFGFAVDAKLGGAMTIAGAAKPWLAARAAKYATQGVRGLPESEAIPAAAAALSNRE